MTDPFSFDLQGLADLESAMKGLEVATQKQVMRSAVRKGMEPVYNQTKINVQSRWGERSGVLHDSVRLRTTAPKNKKWADIIGSVGVYRIRSLEPLAKAYYPTGYYITAPVLAYWFELGTQPHKLSRKSKAAREKDNGGGLHPGMPAKPVLRPTMDANVEITLTRTSNVLGTAIDRKVGKK
ncbi:hypothetical protein [Methylophaga sp.]|uniref:hypothetical protein n=1 Tax=Methylophaga sp. TaxID=2024840 RepID=UPI003A95A866